MRFSNMPSGETLRALETVPNNYLVLSPDLIILTASDLYLEATERTRESIAGKHIFEAFPDNPEFPEADGVQNINASLQEVLRTKRTHVMQVQRYDVPNLNDPGKFIERYWKPSHTPVLDQQGNIQYIIQLSNNVTQDVLNEKVLAENMAHQQEIQIANNGLTAKNEQQLIVNEKLTRVNTELEQTKRRLSELNQELEARVTNRTREIAAVNQQLLLAQQDLHLLNKELEERIMERTNELLFAKKEAERERNRLIRFFLQAPAGICILDGPDLVFELVNANYQALFPGRKLLGRPVFEALPEIANTPVYDILLAVYRTGKTYKSSGLHVPMLNFVDGPVEDRYFNLIYQPRYNAANQVDGMLVFAFEVTEQVLAKQQVEQAEQRMRIAMEAAQLGSFYISIEDRIFVTSPRLKEFFGFAPDEELPYDAALGQIHPDYRQAAADLVEAAITEGVRFDMEYPIIGHKDGKTRWVRGIGMVQHNSDGKDYFTGVLHEITDKKQDEIRKNDFIGMVSHELKTPLTSLKAYLQIMESRAKKAEDVFTKGLLGRAGVQVGKMTGMINGFLDISRLESGKIHIDRQRFNLAELVKETEEESVATITSHQVIFAPVIATWVNADRDKIGQVINNLISNAVKYSPPGSTINIACITVERQAVVSVKDEGAGIAASEKEKLFERYYRAESAVASSVSGFGIGLYLCAELIRRHDGRIWVESVPGEGSTFIFSLPTAD